MRLSCLKDNYVICPICNIKIKRRKIVDHLLRNHKMSIKKLKKLYPELITQWLKNKYQLFSGVEGIDFIVCPICNKRFKELRKHIIVHGINTEEFQKQFPNIQLTCQKTSKDRKESLQGKSCGDCKGYTHPNWKGGISLQYQRKQGLKGIEGIDFVTCPICLQRLFQITSTHLKTHGVTTKEFKQKYPTISLFRQKAIDILRNSRTPKERSETTVALWQNPDYVCKTLEARNNHVGLTIPEIKIADILIEYFPNQFKYVGNGSCWVSAKDKDDKLYHLNPDFISIDDKRLVIEVFGDYWHSEAITKKQPALEESFRRELFASINFKMFVIWEHELKEPDMVVNKIRNFIGFVKNSFDLV